MDTTIKHIRKSVFQMSQADFAALIGRTQPTVSRWEKGVSPTLDDIRAIKQAAKNNRIRLSEKLFFETPKESA